MFFEVNTLFSFPSCSALFLFHLQTLSGLAPGLGKVTAEGSIRAFARLCGWMLSQLPVAAPYRAVTPRGHTARAGGASSRQLLLGLHTTLPSSTDQEGTSSWCQLESQCHPDMVCCRGLAQPADRTTQPLSQCSLSVG